MKTLIAALLAGAAGFGGAMVYVQYVALPSTQPDAQLHADLIGLQRTLSDLYGVQVQQNNTTQEMLALNHEAWAQQQAERAQAQARVNRWTNDLQQFNQRVK